MFNTLPYVATLGLSPYQFSRHSLVNATKMKNTKNSHGHQIVLSHSTDITNQQTMALLRTVYCHTWLANTKRTGAVIIFRIRHVVVTDCSNRKVGRSIALECCNVRPAHRSTRSELQTKAHRRAQTQHSNLKSLLNL